MRHGEAISGRIFAAVPHLLEIATTLRNVFAADFSSVSSTRQESGEALGMSTFTGSGKRASGNRAFWKNNAFWFVVMPTSLVALVFVLGMIVKAVGQ
jgi:hypothetical protein